MRALRYLGRNHLNDADWFLQVNDDTWVTSLFKCHLHSSFIKCRNHCSFVVVENLRQLLAPYNSNLPIRLDLSGSDYVWSGEAIRRIANDLRHCEIPQQLQNCLNHHKIVSLNYAHRSAAHPLKELNSVNILIISLAIFFTQTQTLQSQCCRLTK